MLFLYSNAVLFWTLPSRRAVMPHNQSNTVDFESLNNRHWSESYHPNEHSTSAKEIYVFMVIYAEKFADAYGFVTIADVVFEEAFTLHFGPYFSIEEMIEVIISESFPNLNQVVRLVYEDSLCRVVAYEIDPIPVPSDLGEKCREDLMLLDAYPL